MAEGGFDMEMDLFEEGRPEDRPDYNETNVDDDYDNDGLEFDDTECGGTILNNQTEQLDANVGTSDVNIETSSDLERVIFLKKVEDFYIKVNGRSPEIVQYERFQDTKDGIVFELDNGNSVRLTKQRNPKKF